MTSKIIALFIAFIAFTSLVQGQKIEIRMDGMSDTVYLAKYRGKNLSYADTAISKGGKAIFDTQDYANGMMAFLNKDNSGFFQFIYNGEDITIEAPKENAMQGAKILKSEENKEFYTYLTQLNVFKAKMKAIPTEKKEEKEALNKEVQAYQLKFANDNKEKLVGALIRMSLEIKIPEKPEGAEESFQFQYYLNHYWDNCDLKMDGIQNSEILYGKLVYYFGDKLLLHPDSIIKYADKVIAKTVEGTETFRFVVNFITSTYEKSKILGMDAVFVHMADNYYCPSDNSKAYWMSKEQLDKLCERADKWRPLIIGAKAPYIKLPDSTETNWVAFYDIKADYKILYFWDPDCGHCKKSTPKLQVLYEKKFKARNIEIYTIGKAQGDDFAKWKKFIRDNKLTFTNVGLTKSVFEIATDPKQGAGRFGVHFLQDGITQKESLDRLNKSMNYTTTYDIFSTPRVFVVDKDNRIIAKSLSISQLEEFLDRKQGKEDSKKLFPIEEEKADEKIEH